MAADKTERELLLEITKKIDQLIGLVAVQGASDDKKIAILSNVGLASDFISKVVGITPGAVRMARTRFRRQRSGKNQAAGD